MRLPKSPALLKRRRAARLHRLRTLGVPLAGTLVRLPGRRSRYLTDKVQGKTRTLYVPLDRLDAVTRWNAAFKEGKRLLAELSTIQRALLCGEIRAARR